MDIPQAIITDIRQIMEITQVTGHKKQVTDHKSISHRSITEITQVTVYNGTGLRSIIEISQVKSHKKTGHRSNKEIRQITNL